VAELRDLLGLLAAQHVDDVSCCKSKTAAALAAVNARQKLACRLRRIDYLRWREAVIAIAARFARLAEIREQAHSSAAGGFSQTQHRVKLRARQPLVRRVGFRHF